MVGVRMLKITYRGSGLRERVFSAWENVGLAGNGGEKENSVEDIRCMPEKRYII
jgi:hypothetical protein